MPNIVEQHSISDVKSARVRSRSRAAATSKMELFMIIVNGFQPLTIITKCLILDDAAVLDLPLQVTEVFKIEYKFLLNISNKYWSSCHNDFRLSDANGKYANFLKN